LAAGRLQEVPASPGQARRLLAQARSHLASARVLAQSDPEGAAALAYDAARKALTGWLEADGLRPTTRGGHVAVHDAALALLDETEGAVVRPFDRMRRRRHQAEYPSRETPRVTPEDVLEDAAKAEAIVAMVEHTLGTRAPHPGP
jgi:HEPN domain-containing protein